MELQDKIKELEHKLAIKQAYLSLNFTFPRGNKIPQDIKDLVTNNLKNAAAKYANDEEVEYANTGFSSEEITILKGIVNRVVEKQSAAITETYPAALTPHADTTLVVNTRPIQSVTKKLTPEEKFDSSPKKVNIMTLDNVDPTVRSKISRDDQVRVVGSNKDMFCVEDRKGNKFWIPREDVEI